jgi:hypothetical protein
MSSNSGCDSILAAPIESDNQGCRAVSFHPKPTALPFPCRGLEWWGKCTSQPYDARLARYSNDVTRYSASDELSRRKYSTTFILRVWVSRLVSFFDPGFHVVFDVLFNQHDVPRDLAHCLKPVSRQLRLKTSLRAPAFSNSLPYLPDKALSSVTQLSSRRGQHGAQYCSSGRLLPSKSLRYDL